MKKIKKREKAICPSCGGEHDEVLGEEMIFKREKFVTFYCPTTKEILNYGRCQEVNK